VTAFLAHLRVRIAVLQQEARFPPDDVASLKATVVTLVADVDRLRTSFEQEREAAADALLRVGKALTDDLTHLRDRATGDLTRLESAQAADRAECRSRDSRTRESIDQMARRIEATLDGISDHQELLTGIRALVRMIRTEPA
jgi:hypothetical protein